MWSDAQREAWAPIARFIKAQGSVPAMQLAHAGRKASTYAPWRGHGAVDSESGGWPVVGPSAVPFSPAYPNPAEMTKADIAACVEAFAKAAHRAREAGFEVIEIHAAHGYLLHEFLSALSNTRTDEFGGALENRMRFPLQVIRAVRAAWPDHLPGVPAHLGHRLERRWMGLGAVHRARTTCARRRRGFDRCVHGWQRGGPKGDASPRLSSAVRARHPRSGVSAHRRGGSHQRAGASGTNCFRRQRRCSVSGTHVVARSVLAAPRGEGYGGDVRMAESIQALRRQPTGEVVPNAQSKAAAIAGGLRVISTCACSLPASSCSATCRTRAMTATARHLKPCTRNRAR